MSSVHSGGHAKTDAAQGAFKGRGKTATAHVDGVHKKNTAQWRHRVKDNYAPHVSVARFKKADIYFAPLPYDCVGKHNVNV